MNRSRSIRLLLPVALLAAACAPSAPSTPQIRLDTSNPVRPAIEVSGVSRSGLKTLAAANLTDDEWSAILRVMVKPAGIASPATLAVAGRYGVADGVRFTPLFPFDPGREYEIVFDPARVPRLVGAGVPAARAVVSLPAVVREPSTIVETVYPSGEEIPENQLRMYVQFSAPMGQQGSMDHVMLLDADGRELKDALLPIDTDLWNEERTRFTLIFDPGRVKREILPNRSLGRPLRAGQMITLVVKRDWLDAHATPLKAEFRRAYRIGAADDRPIDPAAWRITPPRVGTRDPVAVTFPEPLDHGLLDRSLRIERSGEGVPGERRIADGETRWMFTPRAAWQAGGYALIVLPILEDLAGNRIGRAFEVLSPGDAAPEEGSKPIRLPFQVAAK